MGKVRIQATRSAEPTPFLTPLLVAFAQRRVREGDCADCDPSIPSPFGLHPSEVGRDYVFGTTYRPQSSAELLFDLAADLVQGVHCEGDELCIGETGGV